jgi:hypothetical protein
MERAIWLIGQLWNCRDVLPGSICALAAIPQGSSYARIVRALRNDIEAPSGCFGKDSNRKTEVPGAEEQ